MDAFVIKLKVVSIVTASTLPAGVAGSAYSQALAAFGGNAPYRWVRTAGTLPPGLLLSAAGILSGTPTSTGTFGFTIQTADAQGDTGSLAMTLTIHPPIIINTPLVLPRAIAGAFYSVTFQATGGTPAPPPAVQVTPMTLPYGQIGAPYSQTLQSTGGTGAKQWSFAGGAAPPGIVLSAAGVLSGSPTAAGVFTFSVRVSDSSLPPQQDTRGFTVRVNTTAVLTITQAAAPGGFVGSPYFFTPTATGGSGARTWSFTGALPPGLVISASTGVIDGAPTTAGTFAGQVVVRDSSVPQQTTSLSISITIASTPVQTSTFTVQPLSGSAGAAGITVTVRVTSGGVGVAGVTVTLGLGANPGGATLSGAVAGVTNGFGNVTLNPIASRGGWSYTLTASAPGTATGVSAPFHVAGFAAAAPLLGSRRNHTATLLPNGEVLVAGGFKSNVSFPGPTVADSSLDTVELYRLTNGVASVLATGPMSVSRGHHSATLLPDGRVLIAGGETIGVGILASAEIYTQGSFTPTGSPMNVARRSHTATLLPNGKVLIAGGVNSSAGVVNSAELFDPAVDSFTPVPGSMSTPHALHTATLLPNGKVLIAGGLTSGGVPTGAVEIYDPVTNSFAAGVAVVITPRTDHTATLMPNGKVLLAGGLGAGSLALTTAEIYDPFTGVNGTITPTGSMTLPHALHTATLLASGKVLITAGLSTAVSAELYDAAAGTFTRIADPLFPRTAATATAMPSGEVLHAGGFTGGVIVNTAGNEVEVYYPTDPPFLTATAVPTGNAGIDRREHVAVRLPDGRVLIAGGQDILGGTGQLATAEIYNPSTGTWSPTGSMSVARFGFAATLLRNGKVLITGGRGSGFVAHATAELYDPATGLFTPTGSQNVARFYHQATMIGNGQVLLTGGLNAAAGPEASAEIYDPVTGVFTPTGSMSSVRFQHRATFVPLDGVSVSDGFVLITGGVGAGGLRLSSSDAFTWGGSAASSGFIQGFGTMADIKSEHTSTLLPDGRVLIHGGVNPLIFVVNAQVWDAGTFGTPIPQVLARSSAAAILLPNGKVLITGGFNGGNSTEIFDPVTQTISPSAFLSQAFAQHVIVLLGNGKVLVGGVAGNYDLYSPAQ